jgi:hypothetical protein
MHRFSAPPPAFRAVTAVPRSGHHRPKGRIASAGVGILVLGGVTAGFTGSASAGENRDSASAADAVVVVTGLDNPRQLNWAPDDTLLVAEAGSGGDTCVTPPPEEGAPPEASGPQCGGLTGGITAVQHPADVRDQQAVRVVDGLFSIAGPDGSSAVGSNGADATDLPGEYIVAETYVPGGLPPEAAGLPGADQLGHLLVVEHDAGQQIVVPYADIAAAEAEHNPDGAQVDSNPYATLFVDPTPDGIPGTDGYALVADAAANTVWKVQPDFSVVPGDCAGDACIPPYEITVFATYPTPADDEVTPEFVPTSLATDADGNVYVGGLGSLLAGEAQVVEYSAAGKELNRWGGFTGITGLAVDERGQHLYVSELFGTNPEAAPQGAPGNVVRVDVAAGTYQSMDVPFPAGVAVDRQNRVFVAAFSVFPAEGVPATGQAPATQGGQLWRIDFTGRDAVGLPVSFPLDTGGAWVPAEPTTRALPDACGGILIAPGDVTGEWRVTRNDKGDLIESRGAATADILGPDGTVLIDELDVSGAGSEFYGADGSARFDFAAPNVFWAYPEEVDVWAAAGLPANFYFTQGRFTETISAKGEVDLTSVPSDAVDVCGQLSQG